jgi:hypothetical protein
MRTCEFCEINTSCYECLKETIERVRNLHKSYEDFGEQWCEHCMTGQWDVEPVKYPCPTIQALDGEA